MIHTKVSMLLSQIFGNLSDFNPRLLRQFADSKGFEKLLGKAVMFCIALRKINLDLKNQTINLESKISDFIKELTNLIMSVANQGLINKESESFEINSIMWFLESVKGANCFDKKEFYDLENLLSKKIENLCLNLRNEYFGKLVKFVKDQNEGKEPSLSIVEDISREFCENWKLKLANMKNEVESRFTKFLISRRIINDAVRGILEIYQVSLSVIL